MKKVFIIIALFLVPVFGYVFWGAFDSSTTLTTLTTQYQEAGTQAKRDFQSLPILPIEETGEVYTVTDDTADGIDIQFANASEKTLAEEEKETSPLTLSFPKDYSQPLQVKLDDKRTIEITDLSGKNDYTVDTLGQEPTKEQVLPDQAKGFFERLPSLRGLASKRDTPQQYLRYTSKDQRKSLLYAYQKDQATGEKKLKHWTFYKEGDGVEQEEYQLKNAKVRVNEEGAAEVFYFGEKEIQNEKVASEVDSNLMARAQRTLAKEMGEDLFNRGQTPDFVIPKPYYVDKEGMKHDAHWNWHEETRSLSVHFTPESYPVALDPTLSFTAPGQSSTGSVIAGVVASDSFGISMTSGDFNADGKIDLAVGASGYSSDTGRAYIFHNDGSIPITAATADVTITGNATSDKFGISLTAGDFNADGKTDLAVGASGYSTSTGRVYIFHNDGSIPTTAATADVTITGQNTSDYFGYFLAAGDFNADSKTDLAVGAFNYSGGAGTGRVYIFHNDGSIPTTAATADMTITGETTTNAFGVALAAGDFNADGKTDLAVGATDYSTYTGRVYIFHNDGSIPTTAATADVTITGQSSFDTFGYTLAAGDFNADGEVDLAAGAYGYTGGDATGRVYIFHNDGSIPTTAATADVIITGETSGDNFGIALSGGDFNADGKTDLVAGASGYATSTGRAYIFYNDGSIPTTAATADVTVTGQSTFDTFGNSFTTGDFNTDGKTDLAIGAYGTAGTLLGHAYIFYSQNGQVNINQNITGEATNNLFGVSMASGDFNADGKTDLAVGANGYSTDTGRTYIFYNDGSIPTTAATADVTITGETTNNFFGNALTAGDFNADRKTDLAVGAFGYSSVTGRVYIFYNDGSIPTTAATADVTITGESSSNRFGFTLAAGDFNADGTTDLAVGAYTYSSETGRAYIFYNDGSIPTTAATADVTITGASSQHRFGASLVAGDFNADGKTDLAVGAYRYDSTYTGRVYLFYNDGSIPTTAGTADVTITGETTFNYFGYAMTSGDFNADGRVDLAVGAYGYSSSAGRVYLFYNDGSIPTTAATADVTITGEAASSSFGYAMTSGDFNADGRVDLAVGAYTYASSAGRVYIFHNDGSIPTTDTTADVIITGVGTANSFGIALAAGDWNADGKTDLAVGASSYSTSTGQAYLYETRGNFAWQIQKQGNSTIRTGVDTSGQELKITGGATGNAFGSALTSGDWNADGKTDLAVSANAYASNTGRVYLFYNDGSLTTTANSADVIITGETAGDYFGYSLSAGDFNADGKVDLAVGAYTYSSSTGRVYIFHNDGSIPITAATADVTITGETLSNYFGASLSAGDFNADGETDLAVGANGYSTDTGRAYIFHNDGSIPTTAGTADVTITGETTNNQFGISLSAGDFNADGETDLVVGAYGYSSSTGRAYIFHNDGSIPTTAATADVTITGETTNNYFGYTLSAGDFNADGKTDIAVGAHRYSSFNGRAYIFHNDGSIPTTAATADVTITGEAASEYFGAALTSGDFNADGKTDLVIGAFNYSGGAGTGRAYIFHNDGSIPTTAGTADVILTGETTTNYFSYALAAGDWNADGRTDLAVGAYAYSSSTGRVYMYTWNDPVITGGATSDSFGASLSAGDFNADGKTDLAVGAYGYSTNTGRVYIFYGDNSIPTTAATADVTITGETTSNAFGIVLTTGDFNADGKTDLAVGANLYSSSTGRVYIFHNDGSIPTTAATADVTITGGATGDFFGASLAAGDFNADGETDLAIGASGYSFSTGRAYIFHNDGSIPTTAATADVTITGDATDDVFGSSMVAGDFNADGKTDLVVGAYGCSLASGCAYIFYNDGSIPTTAATADVTITGGASSDSFGASFAAGDFNADGKTDLAVGAYGYPAGDFTGRAYIFYNDGSIPTTAATADVTITGETAGDNFGYVLSAGDFNADKRTDLAVGAHGYSGGGSTGRAYIFQNDDSIPTTAATADVTITGKTASDQFGVSLAASDFNTDGKIDLAVGAQGYSASTGRVYIFASEAAIPAILPATLYQKGTVKTKGTLKLK